MPSAWSFLTHIGGLFDVSLVVLLVGVVHRQACISSHFASTGDWRHTLLVFSGSCCVAFLAIVAAWAAVCFLFPLVVSLPMVRFMLRDIRLSDGMVRNPRE